ncbi:methylated-DNA--[protein]-cysteine S-methyltransferase [Microbacterium lushaniae]|uniref:methylated-DNA--[protein]-cysteine S-methyltransferase n=1 Tax=Microbacterium lushaniae TaxID=2614639 RepID=A0A5J6L5U6_9MICO|nr:methylated-DNA--[protein]-cysteine S-methyltransferase [Microbacterium lushaniae]QEW03751.1 methylated-DNA--[protein]-cysteine S-methyltransferase [Microbacterium lushaniae]
MTRYASAVHATPVGDVLLTVADDRLLSLRVLHGDQHAAREDLVRILGAVPEDDPFAGAEAAGQLDEYFDGTRRNFDLPLDWSLTRGFSRAALQAVCEIPYGETAAYGEVAVMAGRPRAARAVGTACATSPFSIVVPVHRVVRSDGSPGQYGGHPEVKQYLLRKEQESGA